MNKRGDDNRSVRHTKERLRACLLELMREKPINRITAKELTEAADVNRGTFYFHYSDVYDMLAKIEEDFFEQFERILNEDFTPAEESPYLERIARFLLDNRDFCRVMLSRNGDLEFLERLKDLVERRCSYVWRTLTKDADPKRAALYNSFVIAGSVGVLKKWLDDDFAETPEEVARLVSTLILASVKPCLDQ